MTETKDLQEAGFLIISHSLLVAFLPRQTCLSTAVMKGRLGELYEYVDDE